jgi:hypothetical protein
MGVNLLIYGKWQMTIKPTCVCVCAAVSNFTQYGKVALRKHALDQLSIIDIHTSMMVANTTHYEIYKIQGGSQVD